MKMSSPYLRFLLRAKSYVFGLILINSGLLVPACAQTISEAHLVSHRFGWAIVDFRVDLTNDGGKTWRDITPDHDSSEILSGAYFVDNNTGFLTFLAQPSEVTNSETDSDDNIIIERTTDGGSSWQQSTIPNTQIPSAFLCCKSAKTVFVDPQHGWLIPHLVSASDSEIGDLFSTMDGGKTWHVLPSPPSPEVPTFVTQDAGWTIGAGGHSLWRTLNGGRSWTPFTVPPRNECSSGCEIVYSQPVFLDPLNGRITVSFRSAADKSYVIEYTTRNGGNTWTHDDEYLEENGQALREYLHFVTTPNGMIRITIPGLTSIDIAVRSQHKSAKLPSGSTIWQINPSGFLSNDEGWLIAFIKSASAKEIHDGTYMLLVTEDGGASYAQVSPQVICPTCAPSHASPASRRGSK